MYDDENIFARIIRGQIPSTKVYEDEDVLAFHDIHPAAPVHILVLPKGEYTSFDDFAANADAETISNFFKKTQEVAEKMGLRAGGYRIITNHGNNAAQSVPHFHVHVIGGRPLGGLLPDDMHHR